MRRLACATLLVCAGCAPTLIPLGTAVPVTSTAPRAIPLEIVTRSSAPDPLPLEGGRARYADLEVSLGHAVSTAAVAWADAHRGERPDGWQLLVELAQARAERSFDGFITVTLDVRATLRGKKLGVVEHLLTHRKLRVHVYEARLREEPSTTASAARLLAASELRELGISRLTERILALSDLTARPPR